jgi:hypothetical protein
VKRKTSAFGVKRHGSAASPGDDIVRGVNALLTVRVEEGCERAWAELADIFGVPRLFPHDDPSRTWAESSVRVMIEKLTRELTRLTVAALLLPPPKSPARPLRLVALRPGANGNGRVAGPS